MGICSSAPKIGDENELKQVQQQASAQASVFRQSLVRSHGKDESISSVYNLPHKDEKSAVLGSGATSTVRIIEHKVTGTKYALKTIKLNRVAKAELKALFKEVEIMKKLDHPNIIRVVETFKDFNNLHIIMEMCTGGELFDKLYEQPKNRFEEKKCRELVIKMLSSLHYLHEAGIVHRDLKLENFIFTSRDSDAEIKLIDFGLSRGYLEGTHMRQFVGTPYYMAPEVIKGDYTSACDIWSLGVLVYMMMSGRCPFGGDTDKAIVQNVLEGSPKFRRSTWSHASQTCIDFIKFLLTVDESKRPTATEALEHPWIKGTSDLQTDDGDEEHHDGVDEKFIGHLKDYRNFGQLKQAALMAISFSLDHDQLKEIRQTFQEIDSEHLGIISLHEFKECLHNHGFHDDDDIQRLYEAIDHDHTGQVKYSEFIAACVQEDLYNQEERVVEAFNRLDVDHDGTISKKDLKTMLGDELDDSAIERILDDAAFHRDGLIHLDDFKRMMRGEHASQNAHQD